MDRAPNTSLAGSMDRGLRMSTEFPTASSPGGPSSGGPCLHSVCGETFSMVLVWACTWHARSVWRPFSGFERVHVSLILG